MRTLVLLLAVGCGGGRTPTTRQPPPAPQPTPEPAAPSTTQTTQGDPSTHRSATIVAASTPPASLWRDDAGEGKLATAPSSVADRISIALTATGRCDRGPCAYYEHPVPADTPRAATLVWREYGPERRLATLWGDPDAGAAGVLVEVKAGSAPFWHMHRHDVRVVVLAGTVEYRESGQPARTLAPGSYVLQPRGYKHTESCRAGADCVLYIHGDRGVDVKSL